MGGGWCTQQKRLCFRWSMMLPMFSWGNHKCRIPTYMYVYAFINRHIKNDFNQNLFFWICTWLRTHSLVKFQHTNSCMHTHTHARTRTHTHLDLSFRWLPSCCHHCLTLHRFVQTAMVPAVARIHAEKLPWLVFLQTGGMVLAGVKVQRSCYKGRF